MLNHLQNQALRKMKGKRFLLSLSLAFLFACSSGTVDINPKDQENQETDTTQGAAFFNPFQCDTTKAPPKDKIQKLTKFEYENTLRDIFGDGIINDSQIQEKLRLIPSDLIGGNMRNEGLTSDHVERVFEISQLIGKKLSASSTEMNRFNGSCMLQTTPTSTCIRDFISTLGLSAYRRPLTTDELTNYVTAYNNLAFASRDRAEVLIAFILQSPDAMYRMENDGTENPDGSITLSSYALANRLSYTLTGSMPDSALMMKAHDQSILKDEVYNSEVSRLLASDKAKNYLVAAFETWLKVSEIPSFFYSEHFLDGINAVGLDSEMRQDMRDFLTHVTFDTQGTFKDLLTSNLAFVKSANLAQVYGISVPSDPSGRVAVEDRAGILTKPIMLARTGFDYENSMKRGVFLRQKILCDDIPPLDDTLLPPDFRDAPDTTNELRTSREILEERTSDPQCAGCHSLINPLGFALNDFDGIGRHRAEEKIFDSSGNLLNSLVINASVDLDVHLNGFVQEITGGKGLATALANTSKADSCMMQSWLDFVEKREITEADHCTLREIYSSLIDAEGNRRPLIEMFRTTVVSSKFRKKFIGE